ncbi:MAG: hypothetical protein IPK35_00070 [Saprospiraceae bacterium]|nr:hypothetical protein [Saprospiraceae bacterium]
MLRSLVLILILNCAFITTGKSQIETDTIKTPIFGIKIALLTRFLKIKDIRMPFLLKGLPEVALGQVHGM